MLHFVVPGSIQTLTGGFLYDRRIAEALKLNVIELNSPYPTEQENDALAGLGGSLLIDGLCLPNLPLKALNVAPFALVHHPVSLEAGTEVSDQERHLFAQMLGIITTSHHTADVLRASGVDPRRVRTVQPATDPVSLSRGSRSPGPVRLLCIASITPRKGHDRLLDAFETLRGDYALELIGSPELAPDWSAPILDRAKRLGVRHRGHVSETERVEALHRADLFVFPSAYEGFGMAPVEAIRAGVPVVSTRAGALPEALPNEATVWVNMSPDAIAEGIARATEQLPQLSEVAEAVAPTLRDWSTAATEFHEALQQLGAVL